MLRFEKYLQLHLLRTVPFDLHVLCRKVTTQLLIYGLMTDNAVYQMTSALIVLLTHPHLFDYCVRVVECGVRVFLETRDC